MRRPLTAAAMIGAFLILPATAEQGMANSAGTTGGRGSSITAPNTTSVGRTKPAGSAVPPETREQRDSRLERQKDTDQILKGICIGCGAQ